MPQLGAFAGLTYSSLFNAGMTYKSSLLPAQLSDPHFRLNEATIAPNWIVGLGLKWEIFGGMQRKHKVKKAELDIEQLQNKLVDSRDKLELLLSQKRSSYTKKLKQLDLAAQKETVAKNSRTLARQQYREGLISITERLEAENDYIKMGREKTESLLDQRRAAMETIMATGRLTEQIKYE